MESCDPPFYVYEFAARSGYAIPIDVVRLLRKERGNVVGMKVSDTPFDAVEPYLEEDGIDVFIGSEPLVRAGMERGAVGAVSGSSRPRGRTRSPPSSTDYSPEAHLRVTELRERLMCIPFHAALKQVLVDRGAIRHGTCGHRSVATWRSAPPSRRWPDAPTRSSS